MRSVVFSLLLMAWGTGISVAASQPKAIQAVTIDRGSLNVAGAETVTITIRVARKGRGSVVLVDRDGFPVRTLARDQVVSGWFSVAWDGRDDSGQYVADEAYSVKVDWHDAGSSDTYFPADTPQPIHAIDPRSYSRRSATLTYTLSQPSRVHIQAGTSAIDPKTRTPAGAVMKTVVNREPRTSGTIAEHWNGFDESGFVFVPDLPDFVVAIAASPLPESSIIVFGNRARRFVDTLNNRRGASLFTHRTHGEHHAGLATKDDVSPALAIQPLNATWSDTEHAWIARQNEELQLKLSVQGPTAAAFRTHPATVEIFVDGRRINGPLPKQGNVVNVPLEAGPDIRRVCVNWNSEWGPVAANTVQVLVKRQSRTIGAAR